MTKSSGGGKVAKLTGNSCGEASRSADTTDTPSGIVRDPVTSLDPTPASSRQSSAPGSRPNTAALAFRQASEKYHEALLERRLQLVQQMQAALANTGTVAYQSIAAYSLLLDDVLTTLAFQVIEAGQASNGELHPEVQDSMIVLPHFEPAPQGIDLFGQVIPHAPTDRVSCMHCDWEGAASRFAAHLDKCLSGGRNSRRASRNR